MHHELTQKLWEMFPADSKGDFYSILMYLKHLDHFLHKGIQNMGLPVGKVPDNELDPEVDEALSFVLQSVAEGAGSRGTSIYHGVVSWPWRSTTKRTSPGSISRSAWVAASASTSARGTGSA